MTTSLNKKNDIKVLRFVRLDELEKGKQYEITLWKLITTRDTGDRVLVHLDGIYKTLLPRRYNDDTETVLKDMEKWKLFVKYDGLKDLPNGYRMHQLCFRNEPKTKTKTK